MISFMMFPCCLPAERAAGGIVTRLEGFNFCAAVGCGGPVTQLIGRRALTQGDSHLSLPEI
ncbi:MAG: hypothetical protein ABIS09_10440, partial [Sphingomicrobium sp.]